MDYEDLKTDAFGGCEDASSTPADPGDRQPILLARTSRVEMNLLGVPIYTLNTSASRLSQRITYNWEAEGRRSVFSFERPDNVPFPQVQHAELFYVLLSMFAQRPNDDGETNFRVVDIARNAGRDDKGSVYRTIQEMLWRYSHCSVHWHQAWETKEGEQRYHTWHGPLIVAEDVFALDNNGIPSLKRNPGKSKRERNWHSVKLHPMVVQSIKSQFVRVFLTEILQAGMSDTAKAVYRYFFRFSDSSAVYRSYEHLMQAFPWRSGEKRFVAWLRAQLDELKNRWAIEHYQLQDAGVVVKCTPVRKLKCKDEESNKRAGAATSDDNLLRQFLTMKSQGAISEVAAETVLALLNAGQREQAIKSLRTYLKRSEARV